MSRILSTEELLEAKTIREACEAEGIAEETIKRIINRYLFGTPEGERTSWDNPESKPVEDIKNLVRSRRGMLSLEFTYVRREDEEGS